MNHEAMLEAIKSDHEKLSIKEKCWRKRTLKEQNQQWLRETFEQLGAAWLVVIDGKVSAFGKSLKDQPMQPQIRKICRRTGKFPIVFVNQNFIIIEETISAWHATNEPGDFYPTLSVIFNSTSGTAEVVGDFDTGAANTYVDHYFLLAKNVLQNEIEDDAVGSITCAMATPSVFARRCWANLSRGENK